MKNGVQHVSVPGFKELVEEAKASTQAQRLMRIAGTDPVYLTISVQSSDAHPDNVTEEH